VGSEEEGFVMDGSALLVLFNCPLPTADCSLFCLACGGMRTGLGELPVCFSRTVLRKRWLISLIE
jgi:hypothetical protein